MQAAARHVLAKAGAEPAFCCVLEQTGAIGGAAALWQVLLSVLAEAAASAGQSAQRPATSASTVAVLFVATPHSVQSRFPSINGAAAHWVSFPVEPPAGQSLLDFIIDALCPTSGDNAPPWLLIDSLDAALIYYGAAHVAAALQQLQARGLCSGILSLLHAPGHAPAVVSAIQRLATCQLVLKPISALQRDVVKSSCGRAAHVEANTITLRHSGASRLRLPSQPDRRFLRHCLSCGCHPSADHAFC